MSIYLTKQVSYSSKVLAFEDRGLSGHMSTKAAEAGIQVVSSAPIANLIRYERLDVELPARFSGHYTRYEQRSTKSLLSRFDSYNHVPPPTLKLEMKAGTDTLNNNGMFEVGGGKIGEYSGTPNPAQVSEIVRLGSDAYLSVPAGNVNLSGYLSYIQCWRGFVAFANMGAGDLEGEPLRVFISEMDMNNMKGTPAVEEVVVNGVVTVRGQVARAPGGYFEVSETNLLTGYHMIQPFVHTISPGEAVDYEGSIFPYFKEMLEADADSTFSIFWRLFKNCVASNPEQQSDAQAMYRRGFRNLAYSHAGRIMQHIYFGMNIAIESGTRMILIKDGAAYVGFILKGAMTLCIRNKVVKSLSAEDLTIQLNLLNTHTDAITKIHGIVFELEKLREEEDPTVGECVRNPRSLRSMIQNRTPLTLSSRKEEILKLLSLTAYSQSYWDITPSNILRFLNALDRKENISEEPMYIHGDVFFARASNILEYISVFGPQGPSIYQGTSAKQISRPEVDDPNLAIIDSKKAVPHIPYTKVGIIQAASDWAAVAKNKAFRYTPAKGKGPVAGFSDNKKRHGVIAHPQFEAFYAALRHWIFSGHVVNQPLGKGKRKANDMEIEGEEEQAGPSKKRVVWD